MLENLIFHVPVNVIQFMGVLGCASIFQLFMQRHVSSTRQRLLKVGQRCVTETKTEVQRSMRWQRLRRDDRTGRINLFMVVFSEAGRDWLVVRPGTG